MHPDSLGIQWAAFVVVCWRWKNYCGCRLQKVQKTPDFIDTSVVVTGEIIKQSQTKAPFSSPRRLNPNIIAFIFLITAHTKTPTEPNSTINPWLRFFYCLI